jgi:hypothetical protein
LTSDCLQSSRHVNFFLPEKGTTHERFQKSTACECIR